jgi:hypothetical protein
MPTLALLVTYYIETLFPKQSYIFNSILRFCYIKIYYLNSSLLSFSFRPIDRSLKLSYFLIIILTF